MGSYLSSVAGELKTNCKLTGLSLAKIRELHGGFKSVCDNFAINLTEFESIFQSNQATFGIFDTDGNGLIDALEIFSGIIIFSDSKAEDKIRFLFDLFDFNEIQSISLMDLEFLIQSIMIATAKIFGLGQDLLDIEINQLVRKSFQEGSRITLPQLLVWASQTEEVEQYFAKFRQDVPKNISQKVLEDNNFIIYDKHNEASLNYNFPPGSGDVKSNFLARSAAQLVSNRRLMNFRAWLHTALQPIVSYRLESVTMNNYLKISDEMKIRLEWVYGIRCQDTKRALQYTVGSQYADSTGVSNKYEQKMQQHNEEIIYFVSNIVILLNIHLNKQRFYTQHQQEVISMAISNLNGDLVATGEFSMIKPSVHIWNCRTLENINVLKGIHQKGIHLLAFSADDHFLITCGLMNPSAIIIYDWAVGSVIVSTSISSPSQDIIILRGKDCYQKQQNDMQQNSELQAILSQNEDQKLVEGFVLISLENIVVYVHNSKNNEFQTSYLQLDSANVPASLPICAMSILADYRNQYFKQNSGQNLGGQMVNGNDVAAVDIDHTLKHIFLTGHKDGKILIWRIQGFIAVLTDFGCEVTAMSKCFEGVAFATIMGIIQIWDNYLLKCDKEVNINKLPNKILSSYIVTLDYNKKRLLVLTMNGDALEIQLQEAAASQTIKAQRINSIIRITGRQNKALTILSQSEQTIMTGGDSGIVSSYDISTHELIDIWNVGQTVTSLACLSLDEGGFVVAAGTDQGKIVIRQDWEEFIPRQHECGQSQILDIKFSKNGKLIAAASMDKNVYLLQYQDSEYKALAACKLENGFPVSLNFSEDSTKIVINTNQRKLLVLDPSNFMLMYKPEDLSSCFWSSYLSKFPLISKSTNTQMMPIALGNLSNLVAAGDENGNVYFWKDVESIKENISCNFQTHTSNVQRLELSIDDKRLITLGLADQTICQFKVKQLYYKENQVNLKRGINEVSQNYGLSKIVLNPMKDECLILELNYCFQIQNKKTDLIDDQTVLVRGSNNSTVNTILGRVGFDLEEKVWQRPPSISLILENIYGVLVSDKRHTLMYIHFFSIPDQDVADRIKLKQTLSANQAPNLGEGAQKKLDLILPRILGNDYKNLLKQQQSIEYDALHSTCHKHILYFTSRIAVLYDTSKRTQSFYQGHKLKVSAVAKHPYLRIVATGEVNVNPYIHVWDAQSRETLVVLESSHKGGVLHIVFSTDGEKLISIGMDRTFSIQIFMWRQARSVAFRNTGYNPIFGLKFNPYDDSTFITCGYQHLAEWKIVGTHLSCTKYINVYQGSDPNQKPDSELTLEEQKQKAEQGQQKCILLCVDFISYRLGHSIQSDCIFGNNLGDISTFCSSKYFVLNEQAHPGSPINCIQVTNALSLDYKTVMIITGGEDGLIKIWDASMQLKQQVDMKQACSVKDLKNIKSYGVQSLDVYACDRQNILSTASIKILVGLRSGDVNECLVEFNRNFQSSEDILQNQNMTDEQKANELKKLKSDFQSKYIINFQPIFSGHSSLQVSHKQKKIITCLYPLFGVLASVGNDETLMFWDINRNTSLITKNLGTQATCLDFSPDGKFLAVGLVNGVFLMLESNIEQMNFGTYMEEYSMPTLKVVMCPKEAKASIISVKFSYKGDFLAVSYNNEYKLADQTAEADEDNENPLSYQNERNKTTTQEQKQSPNREASFVLIFVNKLSKKNPSMHFASKDQYVKMQKIQIPLNQYQSSLVNRSKQAVTKMDFSKDDRYLQMCSQVIDKDNNVIIETMEDIFVVYDISKSLLVNDMEQFKATKWPDWSMSSCINARYINQKFHRETDDEEKIKFVLEQCQMTSVCRFTALDNAVMGSLFGEIFAFRFPAMFIDRNHVQEFNYDRVSKRNMAVSKGFDALTSMIASINISEDKKVFVTGNNDQCILQYRVEYEDQDWELDFNNFNPEIPDPFGEIPHYSKFTALLTEIWNQRLELGEIQQNIDMPEYKDPTCSLELEHIIGRRAYDRRNNVKIDCQERIIYVASSLIVFLQDNLDPDAESFIHQSFMRPQNEKFTSTFPEVSCFTLSEDRRLLYIGTNHVESSLIVWEISTNLLLSKMPLPQLSIIYELKVAYDNKHIVVVGVTPEFVLSIMLLEYITQTIICQKIFLHSLPFKIKSVAFLPGYTRRFVTCGVQHMCFWKLQGQSLEYTVGELTIPKAFSNVGAGVYSHDKNHIGKFGLSLVCQEAEMINAVLKNQKQKGGQLNALDEELENIYVTFLCVAILQDTLITAGDDGYLYIWEHERIVRRLFAHEGAILALDSNDSLGFVASGGMEGIVILWRLLIEPRSNIKSLDKLKVFNLRKHLDSQQAVMNPEYNVQSICLGFNRVVIGMRSGSILEVPIAEDAQVQIRPGQDKKSKIRLWMKCIDHEEPIAVAVDMMSQRIFTLTAAGLFTVFDLLTFNVIFQKDFHKLAQNIIAFKMQNMVLLVFENDVSVLDGNLNNGYDELKEYELKLNKISDAKLNTKENVLGVASTSSSTPEVSLYETAGGFAKLTTFHGFKASIKYIDFSTDDYYLQCEDNLGHVNLFEIESSRLINTDTIDFDLEWLGEGLRSYSPLENVRKQYSKDNKILQICKMVGKPIIAIGDEIGTIRMFNYPNKGSDGYFQVYAEHLYNITNCLFTHDQRFFVSVSSFDRCVFKWRVTYNEKKIKEYNRQLVE